MEVDGFLIDITLVLSCGAVIVVSIFDTGYVIRWRLVRLNPFSDRMVKLSYQQIPIKVVREWHVPFTSFSRFKMFLDSYKVFRT